MLCTQDNSLEGIRERLVAESNNPCLPADKRMKAGELAALLGKWMGGTISHRATEEKRKNSHYHTPTELVEWVMSNPSFVPDDLYTYINQIYYDFEAKDDKHYYIASVAKKVMDMVSFEYNIPLGDMYRKFGDKSLFQCMGCKAGGKEQPCNVTCNSGFFCHKHKGQKKSPKEDFQVWKRKRVV